MQSADDIVSKKSQINSGYKLVIVDIFFFKNGIVLLCS
jgi:hypothetical protein